ncbi:MAG: hypothetical protein MZU95_13220 [Desulfomicrobium escambiense]|nr:hypothetical protein [Desulfomicrobium escambiense]
MIRRFEERRKQDAAKSGQDRTNTRDRRGDDPPPPDRERQWRDLMQKKIVWIIIALVVVTGVILGLTVFGKSKNGKVEYKTEVLARGDVEALVVTSGTLNPDRDRRCRRPGLGQDRRSLRRLQLGRHQRPASWPSSTRNTLNDEDRPERGQLQEPRGLPRAGQGQPADAEKANERAQVAVRQRSLISIEEMDDGRSHLLSAPRATLVLQREASRGPGQEHARPEQGRPRPTPRSSRLAGRRHRSSTAQVNVGPDRGQSSMTRPRSCSRSPPT